MKVTINATRRMVEGMRDYVLAQRKNERNRPNISEDELYREEETWQDIIDYICDDVTYVFAPLQRAVEEMLDSRCICDTCTAGCCNTYESNCSICTTKVHHCDRWEKGIV